MFDNPGILGIFMGLAAFAVLYDAIKNRQTLFAEPMTSDARGRLLRLTIFLLLPASVIFHELGHAVAVKLFDGEVVEFGFYFFYGYVQPAGIFTFTEWAWISLAGTIANVILGAIAIGIFWFWPRRTPVNFLLFIFTVLELGNALVFYPAFDALGGIAGDWSMIYSSDTPVFSTVVGVIHIAILGSAALIWKSERFQQGYAERTGRVRRSKARPAQRSGLALTLSRAASEAINGWRHEVQLVADAQNGGMQMVMRWESGEFQRALLLHASQPGASDPHVEFHAAIQPKDPGLPRYERALTRIDGEPNVRELTPYIVRSLEFVDSWDGATVISPN